MSSRRNKFVIIATIATLSMSSFTEARPVSMMINGPTSAPLGHLQFCAGHPADCGRHSRPNLIVRLSHALWARLEAVNRGVNAAVLPATDMEIYGTEELWVYPALAGDCEDYVLEKRRMLIAEGWPASALLITVVRDEAGDGHAVLTVRTDRGDLVLDNKTDDVLVWDDTPYEFIKRQSAESASAWDGITDGRALAVGSLRR